MSRLFEIFVSDYVRITLLKNLRQSVDTDAGLKVFEAPMVVEGFLTEEDDDYYFLGIQPDQIQIAVDKEQISILELCDPNEEKADRLNEMVNEDRSGMN